MASGIWKYIPNHQLSEEIKINNSLYYINIYLEKLSSVYIRRIQDFQKIHTVAYKNKSFPKNFKKVIDKGRIRCYDIYELKSERINKVT